MRSFNVVAALAVLVNAAIAQTTGPVINTPAAYVQCQPVSLTFSGGVAPYYLAVIPGGMPTAASLRDLPTQTAAGTYAWTVNLPAGTNITIRITDGQGNVNYNSARVILSSSDSSCLTATTSGAATGVTTSAPVTSAVVTTPTTPVSTGTTLTVVGPSATVTASSGVIPTNVTTTNGTTVSPSTYNFTCPAGQGLLTYGIATAVLRTVTLQRAASYFGNWIGAAPAALVSSSGTGIGAQRTYTLGSNLTISETLRTNETNTTTGALHQQWNFTRSGSFALTPALTVYNAFYDLTVYTNATSNATSVQYFILGCFNNQTLGLAALASTIQTSITTWATNLTAPSTTTARPSRRAVEFI